MAVDSKLQLVVLNDCSSTITTSITIDVNFVFSKPFAIITRHSFHHSCSKVNDRRLLLSFAKPVQETKDRATVMLLFISKLGRFIAFILKFAESLAVSFAIPTFLPPPSTSSFIS